MSRRKDQPIYDYVATHDGLNDRSIERVAMATGLEPYAVRVIVFESPRLRTRAVMLGWHVVELLAPEPPHVPDETP